MQDLISRSALLVVPNVCKVTEYDESGCGISYLAVSVDAIEAAPAVDAEVVRHGRWIADAYSIATGIDEYDEKFYVVCSECGRTEHADGYDDASAIKFALKEYPYCHCGCKMDAEI